MKDVFDDVKLSKCLRQVPHVAVERGLQRWGSYDYLRVRAASVPTNSFFEKSNKRNEHKSIGAVP